MDQRMETEGGLAVTGVWEWWGKGGWLPDGTGFPFETVEIPWNQIEVTVACQCEYTPSSLPHES